MPSPTTGDLPKVNGHHDDVADRVLTTARGADERNGDPPAGGRDAEPQRSPLPADLLLTSDLREPVELDRGARREAWRAAAAPYSDMHGPAGLLRSAELLHGKVRAGVAQHELLRDIDEDAQLVASHEARTRAEWAGGTAAAKKADLLACAPEGLPALEADLNRCTDNQPQLQQNRKQAQEEYLDALAAAQVTGEVADGPAARRSVLALVKPSMWLAVGVGGADLVAAVVLFSLCVTGVIDFSQQWMALAVAGVIGVGFQGSMLVLGKLLAALEVGARRTSTLLLVCYVAALVVLFPNLDALRAEDVKGLVAFTALNALGGLSTAFVSYWTLVEQADAVASSRRVADEQQRAAAYPTALVLAKQQLDAAAMLVQSNAQRITDLTGRIEQIRQVVLETRVHAVHDEQRVAEIDAQVAQAGARTTLAIEKATTRIEQETHAAQARAASAAAAGTLARSQKDEGQLAELETPSAAVATDGKASTTQAAMSARLRRSLWTGTGLLVAAALALVAGAPVAAGAGALLAGLALVLGLLADHFTRSATPSAGAPAQLSPEQLAGLHDENEEPFVYLPDHYRTRTEIRS